MSKYSLEIPVRRENGVINLALCLAAAEEAFAGLKAKEEKIPGAVSQFFEANPGLRSLNMKAIVSGVVTDVLDFSDIKDLSARLNARVESGKMVEEYIRANTETFDVLVGRQKDGAGSVRYVPRMTDQEKKDMVARREKEALEAANKQAAE